jgi:hypothetical protein
MYGQLTTQFGRYMGHVAKNVGGIYENPKTVEQAGSIYERTPAATQKEAMTFLDQQLFKTPLWLVNKPILDNIDENGLEVVGRLQNTTLNRLISNNTMSKLVAAEAIDGEPAYKITDLFTDLNGSIFAELKSNQTIDVYRRNLQKMYVEKLIAIIKPAASPAGMNLVVTRGGAVAQSGLAASQSDVLSVVKGQLRELDTMIKTSSNAATGLSKYHLQDLSDRIENALDPKG